MCSILLNFELLSPVGTVDPYIYISSYNSLNWELLCFFLPRTDNNIEVTKKTCPHTQYLWRWRQLESPRLNTRRWVVCKITVVINARKRSLRRLCFYTCLSFCPQGRVVSQHAPQVTWPNPPGQVHPPGSSACWEIWATSRQYASCWNAFLLLLTVRIINYWT